MRTTHLILGVFLLIVLFYAGTTLLNLKSYAPSVTAKSSSTDYVYKIKPIMISPPPVKQEIHPQNDLTLRYLEQKFNNYKPAQLIAEIKNSSHNIARASLITKANEGKLTESERHELSFEIKKLGVLNTMLARLQTKIIKEKYL